jgi:hypothetical protein
MGQPRPKRALNYVVHVVWHSVKIFFIGWANLAYPFGRLHTRYFRPGDANHLYLVAHIKLLW